MAERVMSMTEPQPQRSACGCGGQCPKCGTNQAEPGHKLSQTKHLQLGAAESREVPPLVHEVLSAAGQPLDLETRSFMEPRFGHDFGHVRVHSGAAAGQSARGLNALAYTVGHQIVFGAGRFAPRTHEGRRLIAHELAHVAQPLTGVIARQPDPKPPPQPPPPLPFGWSDEKNLNKTVTTVDEKGNIQTGKVAQKGASQGVWRVPVEDLTHGLKTGGGRKSAPKGRAIALIPNTVGPSAPNKDESVSVDVLIHLHGYGAGYRELATGEQDYAQVLQPGELRDVALYEMEQQLLSHVKASKKLLIAILPQGSDVSSFGDLGANSDAYLAEVFAKLVPTFLPKGATPGRLIVSGHSGGGPTTMKIATERAKAGKPTDVLLFDSINFGCAEKVQAVKDGEPQFDKDKKPVMVCKDPTVCKSYEYLTAKNWVTGKINDDIKRVAGKPDADQKRELQRSGTRFRGYTSFPLKTTATCSYGYWYNSLKNDIEDVIKKAKLSEDVRNQLRQNYQVKEVPKLQGHDKEKNAPHERVMSQGNLEEALKD